MDQGMFFDIRDLTCHLVTFSSLQDVKKIIRNTTGFQEKHQLLLHKGIVFGDDLSLQRIQWNGNKYQERNPKDLLYVYPWDPLKLRDPDVGLLELATVPEYSGRDRQYLLSCLMLMSSVQRKAFDFIHKQELMKEAELQLRLHVLQHLQLTELRLVNGLKVVNERKKRIQTVLGLAEQTKTFLHVVDPHADLIQGTDNVQNLLVRYEQIFLALMKYQEVIETKIKKIKGVKQLLGCKDDGCLTRIKKNMCFVDDMCQKSSSAHCRGQVLDEMETRDLRDRCANISEWLKTHCHKNVSDTVMTCMNRMSMKIVFKRP